MSHISIRVSTLRGDLKIEFDVYVKINDKMVHYLRRGDSFEGTRLKRLKEKKLKKLYIVDQDEPNYLAYLKSNIDSAYDDSSKKDIQTRAEIIQGDQQSHVDEVFERPEDKVAYLETKEASAKYVEFLLKNAQGALAILKLENTDKSLSHHGVTVGTLAVALSQKLKMTDQKTIQMLTLGSLVHDIGLHDVKYNVTQPLSLLSKEDLASYRNHAQIGLDRLKDGNHFDPQVLRIIKEHEECLDGSGFPNKMLEKDLDPLSVMVSTCNALDRMIAFEGVSKIDAPKKLMIEQVGKHPLEHIRILSDIVKTL